MKALRLTKSVEEKVPGAERRSGHERNIWAVIDGKRVLRVTLPKVHSGEVPVGTAESIRKQLHLDKEQFPRFADCPMGGPEYEHHLRDLMARNLL